MLRLIAGACFVLALAVLYPSGSQAQNRLTSFTGGDYKTASNSIRNARRSRFRRQPAPQARIRYQRQPQIRSQPRLRTQPRYRKIYRRKRHKKIRRRKKAYKKHTPIWSPLSKTSKDPVQIIVSLPEQRITVYRGSEPVVTSRVSSGKSGHTSPSGVFSILQKNIKHRSNIYSNAPMPFMQRLTWSGIALHASNSVPSYPASHGCIRLRHSFASQLFKYTNMGGHVIVANEKVAPAKISHAILFQPVPRAPKILAKADTAISATDASPDLIRNEKPTVPLRILITRRNGHAQFKEVQRLLNELSFNAGAIDGYMGSQTASAIRRFQATYGLRRSGIVSDKLVAKLYELTGNGTPKNGHIYVRRKFQPVYDAPITINGGSTPLGSHLFTVMHFEPQEASARWLAITLTKGSPDKKKRAKKTKAKLARSSTAQEALDRIDISPEVREHINKILTPGTSLAITNDGMSRETMPKGSDFVLLMQ